MKRIIAAALLTVFTLAIAGCFTTVKTDERDNRPPPANNAEYRVTVEED